MTPIASMVLEMIGRSVDPEVIALAVQAAEEALLMSIRPQTSADVRGQSRLEKDRIRKQIVRDNLRKSTEIRGHPQTSADVPLSKSLLEEKREAASADTWTPPTEDWQSAIAKLGEESAASELTKFREINRRVGSKRESDWRVWVQRAVDWLAKNKPEPSAVTPSIDWPKVVRMYRRTGHWSPQAGPDPESPACRCPREILEKPDLGATA